MKSIKYTKIQYNILTIMLSIGGWVPYSKIPFIKTLIEMEKSDMIQTTISSNPFCPECNKVIDSKNQLDSYLFCQNCDITYDLADNETRIIFSSFLVSKDYICTTFTEYFDLVFNQNSSNYLIENIWYIGDSIEGNLIIFLGVGQISQKTILAVLGLLEIKRKIAVFLDIGNFTSNANQLLKEYPQTVLLTLKFVEDMSIIKEQIATLDATFSKNQTTISKLESVLGNDVIAFYPTLESGWIDEEKILEQSKAGGYEFEHPGISLLWPFGIPLKLKGRDYRPEGVLLQSEGFWLVDTKSCKTHFKFDQEQRDKIKRYIDKVQKTKENYPNFRFKGMGIVTREIKDKDIKNLVGFFSKHEIDCFLFIGLVEPLIGLISKIQKNPEFWYRIIPRTHPSNFLEGKNEFLKIWKDSRKQRGLEDTKIFVLDDNLLTDFYIEVKNKPIKMNPLLSNLDGVVNIIINFHNL